MSDLPHLSGTTPAAILGTAAPGEAKNALARAVFFNLTALVNYVIEHLKIIAAEPAGRIWSLPPSCYGTRCPYLKRAIENASRAWALDS
jgi:hypothetical protein